MIVLPHTPPSPKTWNPTSSFLSPQLLALRASLDSAVPSGNSESVRYVVKLEEYLEGIFDLLSTQASAGDLYADCALDIVLSSSIPWNNVLLRDGNKSLKNIGKKPEPIEWNLAVEVQVTIAAIAFAYIQLGAELTNELIEGSEEDGVAEKWKLVANHHKKAIGYAQFGAKFATLSTGVQLDPRIYILLDKISNIGIQMSILCKFSWINRNSFNENDTFKSGNNGTLCRVAIWTLDEVKGCMNLVSELSSGSGLVELDYSHWTEYLGVVHRYTAAYAGLFLSIEYYQQDKVGHAIGLINFALLSLQSKTISQIKPKRSKVLSRFKSKIANKRNETYIAGLQSITSLRIDKSLFQELSGVVLNDLSLLFDQLIQCHLKYTKENDNLRFDAVVDWQDIHSDSKWPLGSKIPVSAIPNYCPKVLAPSSQATPSGRQYF